MAVRMAGGSAEAAAFSRYLVGDVAPSELLERYETGCRTLFTDAPDAEDAALLDFARRHGWSVPYLDAAVALRRPHATLRARLLLMAAVLETSPRYADRFLPVDTAALAFVWRLARHGVPAVMYAVIGLMLLPLALRSSR
jgi:hypothetical protein